MTNKTIGLFLLATTFLSSPAGAAALTPTLDTIKREAADLSGNFVLSELTSALPTGAVEVMIGDKSYYFMPSGENAALLATLAGTPAGSLIASENGIFELNGQKYGFDVASIPDSVFEYAENSVKDYNFIVKEADAEGNLTTKRYKINLKPDNFSASKSITWMEVSKDKKVKPALLLLNFLENRVNISNIPIPNRQIIQNLTHGLTIRSAQIVSIKLYLKHQTEAQSTIQKIILQSISPLTSSVIVLL